MALVDIKVPDIGDFAEVAVIELMVKVGDTIKVDQSILTVESDKASMEIPSSHAGVVKEVKVAIGDKVKEGSVVLSLEVAADAAIAAAVSAPAAAAAPAPAAQAATPVAAVAVAVAVASGPVEVKIPDIGDFKDVAVIEILVKVGDTIKVEQSLMTVESDKAAMEIPSSAAGVLKELKVKLGDKVNIGDLIAILEGSSAVASAVAPAASAPVVPVAVPQAAASAPVAAVASAPAAAVPAHAPTSNTLNLPHASPSVRKFARELGVPLAEVKGSGQKGRITEQDIQQFTKSVMSGAIQTIASQATNKPATANSGGDLGGMSLLPWPKVDFTKFGPVERKDLSRIKKISGANLHRNWVMIPHVTNHDNADITELEAFRVQMNKENEKAGIKTTMLAFVIKAVVSALKKFPDFNASLDGDQLVYKQYYNIGFAADTPNGLVVPVLKDADKKGIFQISTEMGELSKKARDGKLGGGDMQGGCISISSLGGIGGRYFHPIINAPEVAILGLSKSVMEPVWNGSEFKPRLMLPLSLSYDHRVIDGAAAARFNAYLGQVLSDYRRILL
ncbi:MAG: dihydrolipoyllysine-residue acetyltransferase [Pseudomonadota bacterium]|jgi:pyruvate dehydrogenase E2 component (dihydrolipoamide acetyltransferase)